MPDFQPTKSGTERKPWWISLEQWINLTLREKVKFLPKKFILADGPFDLNSRGFVNIRRR